MDARFFLFCVVVHSEHSHDGTTGTNDTELDELKEMVRQMGNRIDILSAANTDLSLKLQKAKETFDAQTADLNARLLKSFERIQELERKNQSFFSP